MSPSDDEIQSRGLTGCNLLRGLQLGRTDWLDLIRATGELALARSRFGPRAYQAMLKLGDVDRTSELPSTSSIAPPIVDRVAYAIPRMGARVPWRADCFVQALAAQRWLKRRKIATTMYLGVRRDAQGTHFHAWLKHGNKIVTGGDIAAFVPLEPNPCAGVPKPSNAKTSE